MIASRRPDQAVRRPHRGRPGLVQLRPGTVTGFLGPNGAGKSTTLRILVGLTTPTAAPRRSRGSDYRGLPNPGRKVGVLLDASARHSGRTGREMLTLAAVVLGRPGAGSTGARWVGLAEAGGRRVGRLLAGHAQRLGLAAGPAGRPAGAGPRRAGQRPGPRGHLLDARPAPRVRRPGGTVLLSSHLLREVEAVADRLVVIARGRIVAQGDKDELLRRPGGSGRAPGISRRSRSGWGRPGRTVGGPAPPTGAW